MPPHEIDEFVREDESGLARNDLAMPTLPDGSANGDVATGPGELLVELREQQCHGFWKCSGCSRDVLDMPATTAIISP